MNPSDADRREALSQRIAAVRVVLVALWDPLGVGDNPALADEYDSYLGGILSAIDAGPEALRQALLVAEADLEIGAQQGADGRDALVERLMDFKA